MHTFDSSEFFLKSGWKSGGCLTREQLEIQFTRQKKLRIREIAQGKGMALLSQIGSLVTKEEKKFGRVLIQERVIELEADPRLREKLTLILSQNKEISALKKEVFKEIAQFLRKSEKQLQPSPSPLKISEPVQITPPSSLTKKKISFEAPQKPAINVSSLQRRTKKEALPVKSPPPPSIASPISKVPSALSLEEVEKRVQSIKKTLSSMFVKEKEGIASQTWVGKFYDECENYAFKLFPKLKEWKQQASSFLTLPTPCYQEDLEDAELMDATEGQLKDFHTELEQLYSCLTAEQAPLAKECKELSESIEKVQKRFQWMHVYLDKCDILEEAMDSVGDQILDLSEGNLALHGESYQKLMTLAREFETLSKTSLDADPVWQERIEKKCRFQVDQALKHIEDLIHQIEEGIDAEIETVEAHLHHVQKTIKTLAQSPIEAIEKIYSSHLCMEEAKSAMERFIETIQTPAGTSASTKSKIETRVNNDLIFFKARQKKLASFSKILNPHTCFKEVILCLQAVKQPQVYLEAIFKNKDKVTDTLLASIDFFGKHLELFHDLPSALKTLLQKMCQKNQEMLLQRTPSQHELVIQMRKQRKLLSNSKKMALTKDQRYTGNSKTSFPFNPLSLKMFFVYLKAWDLFSPLLGKIIEPVGRSDCDHYLSMMSKTADKNSPDYQHYREMAEKASFFNSDREFISSYDKFLKGEIQYSVKKLPVEANLSASAQVHETLEPFLPETIATWFSKFLTVGPHEKLLANANEWEKWSYQNLYPHLMEKAYDQMFHAFEEFEDLKFKAAHVSPPDTSPNHLYFKLYQQAKAVASHSSKQGDEYERMHKKYAELLKQAKKELGVHAYLIDEYHHHLQAYFASQKDLFSLARVPIYSPRVGRAILSRLEEDIAEEQRVRELKFWHLDEHQNDLTKYEDSLQSFKQLTEELGQRKPLDFYEPHVCNAWLQKLSTLRKNYAQTRKEIRADYAFSEWEGKISLEKLKSFLNTPINSTPTAKVLSMIMGEQNFKNTGEVPFYTDTLNLIDTFIDLVKSKISSLQEFDTHFCRQEVSNFCREYFNNDALKEFALKNSIVPFLENFQMKLKEARQLSSELFNKEKMDLEKLTRKIDALLNGDQFFFIHPENHKFYEIRKEKGAISIQIFDFTYENFFLRKIEGQKEHISPGVEIQNIPISQVYQENFWSELFHGVEKTHKAAKTEYAQLSSFAEHYLGDLHLDQSKLSSKEVKQNSLYQTLASLFSSFFPEEETFSRFEFEAHLKLLSEYVTNTPYCDQKLLQYSCQNLARKLNRFYSDNVIHAEEHQYTKQFLEKTINTHRLPELHWDFQLENDQPPLTLKMESKGAKEEIQAVQKQEKSAGVNEVADSSEIPTVWKPIAKNFIHDLKHPPSSISFNEFLLQIDINDEEFFKNVDFLPEHIDLFYDVLANSYTQKVNQPNDIYTVTLITILDKLLQVKGLHSLHDFPLALPIMEKIFNHEMVLPDDDPEWAFHLKTIKDHWGARVASLKNTPFYFTLNEMVEKEGINWLSIDGIKKILWGSTSPASFSPKQKGTIEKKRASIDSKKQSYQSKSHQLKDEIFDLTNDKIKLENDKKKIEKLPPLLYEMKYWVHHKHQWLNELEFPLKKSQLYKLSYENLNANQNQVSNKTCFHARATRKGVDLGLIGNWDKKIYEQELYYLGNEIDKLKEDQVKLELTRSEHQNMHSLLEDIHKELELSARETLLKSEEEQLKQFEFIDLNLAAEKNRKLHSLVKFRDSVGNVVLNTLGGGYWDAYWDFNAANEEVLKAKENFKTKMAELKREVGRLKLSQGFLDLDAVLNNSILLWESRFSDFNLLESYYQNGLQLQECPPDPRKCDPKFDELLWRLMKSNKEVISVQEIVDRVKNCKTQIEERDQKIQEKVEAFEKKYPNAGPLKRESGAIKEKLNKNKSFLEETSNKIDSLKKQISLEESVKLWIDPEQIEIYDKHIKINEEKLEKEFPNDSIKHLKIGEKEDALQEKLNKHQTDLEEITKKLTDKQNQFLAKSKEKAILDKKIGILEADLKTLKELVKPVGFYDLILKWVQTTTDKTGVDLFKHSIAHLATHVSDQKWQEREAREEGIQQDLTSSMGSELLRNAKIPPAFLKLYELLFFAQEGKEKATVEKTFFRGMIKPYEEACFIEGDDEEGNVFGVVKGLVGDLDSRLNVTSWEKRSSRIAPNDLYNRYLDLLKRENPIAQVTPLKFFSPTGVAELQIIDSLNLLFNNFQSLKEKHLQDNFEKVFKESFLLLEEFDKSPEDNREMANKLADFVKRGYAYFLNRKDYSTASYILKLNFRFHTDVEKIFKSSPKKFPPGFTPTLLNSRQEWQRLIRTQKNPLQFQMDLAESFRYQRDLSVKDAGEFLSAMIAIQSNVNSVHEGNGKNSLLKRHQNNLKRLLLTQHNPTLNAIYQNIYPEASAKVWRRVYQEDIHTLKFIDEVGDLEFIINEKEVKLISTNGKITSLPTLISEDPIFLDFFGKRENRVVKRIDSNSDKVEIYELDGPHGKPYRVIKSAKELTIQCNFDGKWYERKRDLALTKDSRYPAIPQSLSQYDAWIHHKPLAIFFSCPKSKELKYRISTNEKGEQHVYELDGKGNDTGNILGNLYPSKKFGLILQNFGGKDLLILQNQDTKELVRFSFPSSHLSFTIQEIDGKKRAVCDQYPDYIISDEQTTIKTLKEAQNYLLLVSKYNSAQKLVLFSQGLKKFISTLSYPVSNEISGNVLEYDLQQGNLIPKGEREKLYLALLAFAEKNYPLALEQLQLFSDGDQPLTQDTLRILNNLQSLENDSQGTAIQLKALTMILENKNKFSAFDTEYHVFLKRALEIYEEYLQNLESVEIFGLSIEKEKFLIKQIGNLLDVTSNVRHHLILQRMLDLKMELSPEEIEMSRFDPMQQPTIVKSKFSLSDINSDNLSAKDLNVEEYALIREIAHRDCPWNKVLDYYSKVTGYPHSYFTWLIPRYFIMGYIREAFTQKSSQQVESKKAIHYLLLEAALAYPEEFLDLPEKLDQEFVNKKLIKPLRKVVLTKPEFEKRFGLAKNKKKEPLQVKKAIDSTFASSLNPKKNGLKAPTEPYLLPETGLFQGDRVQVEVLQKTKELFGEYAKKISTKVETDREILEGLANHSPNEMQALLKETSILAQQSKPVEIGDLIHAFLTKNSALLKKGNPTLTLEMCEQIHPEVRDYLILATHSQYVNQLLQRVEKFEESLQKGGESVEAKVALQELKEHLALKRVYDVNAHPEYLVLEYFSGFLLRKAQIDALGKLKIEKGKITETKHLGKAVELIMGSGKTSVIIPLLALFNADGENIPIITMPKPLIESISKELDSKLHKAFRLSLETLSFDVKSNFNVLRLESILDTLKSAKESKKVLIISSESFLAMDLKLPQKFDHYLELKKFPNGNQAAMRKTAHELQLFIDIFNILETSGSIIIDEIDSILDVLKSFHFTIGKYQKLINVCPIFPETVKELYQFLSTRPEFKPALKYTTETAYQEVKAKIVKAIVEGQFLMRNKAWNLFAKEAKSWERKLLERFLNGETDSQIFSFLAKQAPDVQDAMVILEKELGGLLSLTTSKNLHEHYGPKIKINNEFADKPYFQGTHQEIKEKLINAVIEGVFHTANEELNAYLKALTSVQRSFLKKFLNGEEELRSLVSFRLEKCSLKTLEEMFKDSVPLTTSKNLFEKYGLTANEESDEDLAHPYHQGRAAPPETDFATLIENLNYLMQKDLEMGSSLKILRKEIDELQEACVKELAANQVADQSELPGFKAFQQLVDQDPRFDFWNLKEKDYPEILKIVNKNPIKILHLTYKHAVPQIKFFPKTLNTNGQFFGISFKQSHGTSGTLRWNAKSYPKSISSIEYSDTSEKTRALLLKQPSQVVTEVTLPNLKDEKSVEEFLLNILSIESPPISFIDAANHFRGIPNQTVAKIILTIAKKKGWNGIKGVAFYDQHDKKKVIKKNDEEWIVEDLGFSKLKKHEILAYYDQSHTTGADIKLDSQMKAAVSIGRHTISRDDEQSVWRLRELDKFQTVYFVVSKEDREIIVDTLKKEGKYPANSSSLSVENMLDYTEIQQKKREDEDVVRSFKLKLNAFLRKKVKQSMNRNDVDEAAEIYALTKGLVETTEKVRPYEIFLNSKEKVHKTEYVKKELARLLDSPEVKAFNQAPLSDKWNFVQLKEELSEHARQELEILPEYIERIDGFEQERLVQKEQSQEQQAETTLEIQTNVELSKDLSLDVDKNSVKTFQASPETKQQIVVPHVYTWATEEVKLFKQDSYNDIPTLQAALDSDGHGKIKSYFSPSLLCSPNIAYEYNYSDLSNSDLSTWTDRLWRKYISQQDYPDIGEDHKGFRRTLLIQDKKTKQVKLILLDQNDALQWKKILLGTSTKPEKVEVLPVDEKGNPIDKEEVRLALYDAYTGMYIQGKGKDRIDETELKKDLKFRELIVQVKFLNGELHYSAEELNSLVNWFKTVDHNALESFFKEKIMRWNQVEGNDYHKSGLKQAFEKASLLVHAKDSQFIQLF